MQIATATSLALILSLGSFIALRTPVPMTATAELLNAEGKSLGRLSLVQEEEGVRISGSLSGLPAGPHAMHIHAVGQCHAPGFESAGAHFNPFHKKHGTQNKDGPHAGDLPNFTVFADGSAVFDFTAKLVTLRSGENSLFTTGGTCLVIHEKPDDDVTDPAGNAGSRIACGVIHK
jgi:Cu-Zn family superoxide dismutase